MDFMATTWFLPVAITVWCVILAALLWGYFLALRPRRGTLQWMDELEPSNLSWAGANHSLTNVDGILLAVLALFGGLVSYGMSGGLAVDFSDFAAVFFAAGTYVVLPMVTAGAAFWLAKSMTGHSTVAVLVAILVALDVFAPAGPMAVIVVTACLLYSYSGQAHQPNLWHRLTVLLLSGAVMAVGFHFYPGLILLLVPTFGVIFLVNWEYFRETGHFWRCFLGHGIMVLASAVVTLIACYIPQALVGGLPIFGTVFYAEFYQMMLPQVAKNLATAFNGFALYYALFTTMTHWPLLLMGVVIVPILCHGAVKEKGSSALYALIWGGAVLVAWLSTSISALFFCVALGLGYLASRLWEKGRYLLLIMWVIALFLGILSMYLMILM
ncbi:MAG: hypothetical protein R3Y62_06310 [Eubacteriales bacterium]